MHTSKCKKQNARHTGIDIFQFMMLALWTVVSKHLFLLSPILAAYQHTDNMAYLLVAFGQFAHTKITAKIMCTVQLLQHLILRCAQRMCTAHNKYVQVMHMTYRQAGCYQAKIVLKRTMLKPVLGSDMVTQVRLICRKERSSRCLH